MVRLNGNVILSITILVCIIALAIVIPISVYNEIVDKYYEEVDEEYELADDEEYEEVDDEEYELTDEEEQEESAIISYDELLSKTQAIPKVEEVVEVKSENYKHEEDFLDRLKNLNDNLK